MKEREKKNPNCLSRMWPYLNRMNFPNGWKWNTLPTGNGCVCGCMQKTLRWSLAFRWGPGESRSAVAVCGSDRQWWKLLCDVLLLSFWTQSALKVQQSSRCLQCVDLETLLNTLRCFQDLKKSIMKGWGSIFLRPLHVPKLGFILNSY